MSDSENCKHYYKFVGSEIASAEEDRSVIVVAIQECINCRELQFTEHIAD